MMNYYDKNGHEITDGCWIELPDGTERAVFAIDDPVYPLGYDATSSAWIKSGRAAVGEFGLYPLTPDTARSSTVICDYIPMF